VPQTVEVHVQRTDKHRKVSESRSPLGCWKAIGVVLAEVWIGVHTLRVVVEVGGSFWNLMAEVGYCFICGFTQRHGSTRTIPSKLTIGLWKASILEAAPRNNKLSAVLGSVCSLYGSIGGV